MTHGTTGARDRAATRLNFFLAATLVCEGGAELTARVRNLSAGGMMIETKAPLVPGTALVAEIRGIGQIPGEVAWARAGRAGISFRTEVDPERARRPIGGGRSETAYVRPIIVTERKLSDAAREEPKTRLD